MEECVLLKGTRLVRQNAGGIQRCATACTAWVCFPCTSAACRPAFRRCPENSRKDTVLPVSLPDLLAGFRLTNGEDQAFPHNTHTVQAAAPARKQTQLPLADVSSFSLGIGSVHCICLTVQKKGKGGKRGSRGLRACQVRFPVNVKSVCPIQENGGVVRMVRLAK